MLYTKSNTLASKNNFNNIVPPLAKVFGAFVLKIERKSDEYIR